jgi:nicotinamide mononucleotide transporter
MSWIELTATVLGIAYVLLMIRRNILCWVAGNASVALQAVSFYQVRLYADMFLQGVYFGMGCYGFWRWWKTLPTSDEIRVLRIRQPQTWSRLIVMWVAGSMLWAWTLRTWTNAAIPELDATLATASLIATWMQANRYIENWLLWIGIDAAYAMVYWSRDLTFYVVLYSVFVVLAWRGWKQWNKRLSDCDAIAGRH